MNKKENLQKKNELLRKIGKYSVAAGAVLLSGNMANANAVVTAVNIDIKPFHNWGGGLNGYWGIDFDGDNLDELVLWAWTQTSSTFFSSYNNAAKISINSAWDSWSGGKDPDCTTFEVIQGGPFGGNGDLAPLPPNRIIGANLAVSSSYWSDSSWDTVFMSQSDSVVDGNFGDYLGETRYIGVRYSNDGGTNWHYGWIGIQMDNNIPFVASGNRFGELINYGYQTELNTPILAGSGATVPLLPIASAAGLGLVGLFGALRARRKKQTV